MLWRTSCKKYQKDMIVKPVHREVLIKGSSVSARDLAYQPVLRVPFTTVSLFSRSICAVAAS